MYRFTIRRYLCNLSNRNRLGYWTLFQCSFRIWYNDDALFSEFLFSHVLTSTLWPGYVSPATQNNYMQLYFLLFHGILLKVSLLYTSFSGTKLRNNHIPFRVMYYHKSHTLIDIDFKCSAVLRNSVSFYFIKTNCTFIAQRKKIKSL